MALRDQPYLPLYVQDVLTDERLIECSAEAHGVYFRLLCILHKQETYGLICLKQKYKQTDKQVLNFAQMLCKQMPFEARQIHGALEELIAEGVLILNGDNLYQKRMLRDGELSTLRADAGKKGGSSITKQYGTQGYLYLMSDGFDKNKIGISLNPKNRLYRLRYDLKLPKHFVVRDTIQVKDMGLSEDIAHEFFADILDGEWLKSGYSEVQEKFALLKAKLQAKSQANTEYENENEYENEYENDLSKGGKGGKRSARFKPPTQQEVETYLSLKGQFKAEELTMLATRFINFYESKNWFVGKNKMTNWKAAATNSLAWDRSFARSTSQSQQRGTSIVQVQEIFNELNGKQ